MHMNTVKHMDNTIKCSRCTKSFFANGFKVDRLGKMLKTCLECNARSKVERERNKCPHGRVRCVCKDCGGSSICEHGRRKAVCEMCSPEKFCMHGHCTNRHTCEICDPASNERRKKVRNACDFAQQKDGWPFKHYCFGPQIEYDAIVSKWMATFTKLLEDGVIDEERHEKILANLSPWIAEDYTQMIRHLKGAVVPR